MRPVQKKISAVRRGLACAFSLTAILITSLVSSAEADGWDTVSIIQHSTYQAVNADGTSAYSPTGSRIRLRGIVLNNNEDWLDPTSDYCTEAGHLWDMGGEAEFYIQAVNLDGTIWDPNPVTPFDDFGGTASWMGQNFGNHIWHYDPDYYTTDSQPWNYTETAWYSELDRLGLYRPGTSLSEFIRTGDLVEIRAQGGLYYNGKMNVNEQHNNSASHDFEVVVLDKGFGLPEAEEITLSDLKDAGDAFLFDSTRATGGEHYQSTLVTINDVCLVDTAGWGKDTDLTLTDATGRTLTLHLGLNDGFSTVLAPTGYFNVTGILDQSDYSGKGGYQLLAMSADDFVAVPEPATILLFVLGAALGLLYRMVHRQRFLTS